MEESFLDVDGQLLRVESWLDSEGNDTTAELAVGAIGKNRDGSWWGVAFPGHKAELVTQH